MADEGAGLWPERVECRKLKVEYGIRLGCARGGFAFGERGFIELSFMVFGLSFIRVSWFWGRINSPSINAQTCVFHAKIGGEKFCEMM